MKKSLITSILLIAVCTIMASTRQINWHIQTWRADTTKVEVLSFDHATYNHSLLPHYTLPLKENEQITLTQTEFTICTPEELAIILNANQSIPQALEITQGRSAIGDQTTAWVDIFPFITENGIIKKLTSFTYQSAQSQESGLPLQKSIQSNDGSRYRANSLLESGKWIKISIPKTGIYKLTYSELQAMGIVPEHVRIFGYGGAMLPELFTKPYIDDLPEVAIHMEKGADNLFNAGDFILFYGQGPVSWEYIPKDSMFQHTDNYYATAGYYFITSDVGIGKKIDKETPVTTAPDVSVNTFTDYYVHNNNLLSIGDINSGRELYGEEFNSQKNQYIFKINTPNLLTDKAKIRVDAAAQASQVSKLFVSYGNTTIATLSFAQPVSYSVAYGSSSTQKFLTTTANELSLTFQYSLTTNNAWLNFFELNYKRALSLVGGEPLFFRNIDYLNEKKTLRYVVSNSNASIVIWNITDPLNITAVPTTLSGTDLSFIAPSETESNHISQFVALNPQYNYPTPTVVGTIANQNLHALEQADMVIITPPEFSVQAERLANAHRAYDNMQVHVVDVNQIYNEFSSGTPDGTAYRRLMKMFYDRSFTAGTPPKHLLLFGSGSFDNRELLPKGHTKPIRKILTYQSYNSLSKTSSYPADDYFAYLDDNSGMMHPNDQMTIGIGRFPAYTKEQAKLLVDKTLEYIEDNQKGSWKNEILFLADDGDDHLHARDANSIADKVRNTNKSTHVKKLFFDAYPQETTAAGDRYPQVKKLLLDNIKNGVLMVNYMGHGGYDGWADEAILTAADIEAMYNDRYPIFVTATCDFSGFDGYRETAGEKLLWNSNGGSMAILSTTRTVFASHNADLNEYFMNNFYSKDSNNEALQLGEIMRLAKNTQKNTTNKFAFLLFGDPALRINYPHKYQVITDTINNSSAHVATDTISALSEITLQGHIADLGNNKQSDFNGVLAISVFDKKEDITTLANEKKSLRAGDSIPFVYKDRPNIIFSGSAKVINGEFSITFRIPKDIRYNFGTGRIVYYAADELHNYEANGYYEDFIIGGESAEIIHDDQGPDVALYLNTSQFVDGAKVNESPLFMAKIYDESGINTTGSGFGHDIILRIDNDPNQETVLNNSFIAQIGSYKAGTVNYLLTNLSEGKHQLTFRVWDLMNNSTTKTLNFVVDKNIKPHLEDLFAFPNPATDMVTFVYQHDRPKQPLTVTATVFDLAGRKIWESNKTIITNDNRTEITWNFADEGMAVAVGVYLVRMDVTTNGSQAAVKTIKLIITPK